MNTHEAWNMLQPIALESTGRRSYCALPFADQVVADRHADKTPAVLTAAGRRLVGRVKAHGVCAPALNVYAPTSDPYSAIVERLAHSADGVVTDIDSLEHALNIGSSIGADEDRQLKNVSTWTGNDWSGVKTDGKAALRSAATDQTTWERSAAVQALRLAPELERASRVAHGAFTWAAGASAPSASLPLVSLPVEHPLIQPAERAARKVRSWADVARVLDMLPDGMTSTPERRWWKADRGSARNVLGWVGYPHMTSRALLTADQMAWLESGKGAERSDDHQRARNAAKNRAYRARKAAQRQLALPAFAAVKAAQVATAAAQPTYVSAEAQSGASMAD